MLQRSFAVASRRAGIVALVILRKEHRKVVTVGRTSGAQSAIPQVSAIAVCCWQNSLFGRVHSAKSLPIGSSCFFVFRALESKNLNSLLLFSSRFPRDARALAIVDSRQPAGMAAQRFGFLLKRTTENSARTAGACCFSCAEAAAAQVLRRKPELVAVNLLQKQQESRYPGVQTRAAASLDRVRPGIAHGPSDHGVVSWAVTIRGRMRCRFFWVPGTRPGRTIREILKE